MINLDSLKKIQALNINADQMTQDTLEAYEVKVTAFVDKSTMMIEHLKQAVHGGSKEAIPEQLGQIANILSTINADKLMEESLAHKASAPTKDMNTLIAELTSFSSRLAALSIDLQMCLYADMSTAAAIPVPEAAPAPEAQVSTDELKLVLAVDDAPFFLQSLKAHLADSPVKLVCVSSGADALRFVEKRTPHLFILDVEMPEMDGYELAMQIRQKGMKAPIVFLTGNSNKESVIQALSVGASDFIVKPSSKAEVLSRVGRFII